jgi:hypothetical protein
MSAEATPNASDLQPKPMKGKYDGRKRNGAHRAAPNNRGRKPRWLRHLGRNDALKVLDEFDAIAHASEIYAAAWAKGNHSLCFEMRKYADDRLLGKPFTAENPAKGQAGGVLTEDTRLQDAIQKLIPQLPVKNVM